jgi:serine protease Do
MRQVLLSLVLVALSAAPGSAVTPASVRLKNGAEVKGELLKERADALVLDLGFTILTIPRNEVAEIKQDDQAKEAKPANANRQRSEDIFYTEVDRSAMAVEENVKRVSEGVVQIQTATGLGSGFVINSLGHVVTNQHVIAGEQEIRVVVYRQKPTGIEKETYSKVKIIAMNGFLDLALLQIDDEAVKDIPHVVLGESDTIAQGEHVFAIGSPLGLERTVSQGIVSVRARESAGRWYIQTTTQINPGNSGGPLFNAKGEVVGVTNMKLAATGIEGVGFAIPASLMKLFLKNREAFAFDARNPNHGFRYLPPVSSEKPKAEATSETSPKNQP